MCTGETFYFFGVLLMKMLLSIWLWDYGRHWIVVVHYICLLYFFLAFLDTLMAGNC